MSNIPKQQLIRSKDVYAKLLVDRGVQVIAHAYDSNTPVVILKVLGVKVELEDVAAEVLIKHLQKALTILPSSK